MVPKLLESTERAILAAAQAQKNETNDNLGSEDHTHAIVIAARFHGFYEYLHPSATETEGLDDL